MWPKVEMIGKFLTDHFPPANSRLGTDGIQPAGISIEQLQIMETLTKGQIPSFLNG
jgi:hypothetical protein